MMIFVPYCRRIAIGGETLPHSDGEMMSHTQIRDKIALLRKFLAASRSRDNAIEIQSEIGVLLAVLGERPDNRRTCGEFAMDIEWTIYETRPEGLMEQE